MITLTAQEGYVYINNDHTNYAETVWVAEGYESEWSLVSRESVADDIEKIDERKARQQFLSDLVNHKLSTYDMNRLFEQFFPNFNRNREE